MELLKCRTLLEKYFEGQTSLNEDNELKMFLSAYSGNDADLLGAKTIFLQNELKHKDSMDLSFQDFITQADKPKFSKTRRLYVASSAIAASIVLAITMLTTMYNNDEQVVYAYINGQAITNKVEAMQYSQNALKTMSANLNKGTHNLSYMNQLNKPAALITAH